MTLAAEQRPVPSLPHWNQTPEDIAAAVREIKRALRARIEAHGRTVEQAFAAVEERVGARVAEIEADRERGEEIWPVLDYDAIAAGAVPPAEAAKLAERGCVVVRGHFPHEQARTWDRDIVDYVERNKFFETYTGPGDDFFGSVGSKPEIYPVYWSEAQMRARQSDRTATIQSFLNSFWKHTDDEGTQWFDPDRDALYPDRIRRRPPGTDSSGLGTHCDPGTLDLWMTQEYQKAFRHLFSGQVERYDPWDPAHRTDGPQYPGSTMCSAFRTFQGWTALSDMDAEAAKLAERGCVVVRGHFPHEQARTWDRDIVDYVERNKFFETYTGPGDDFFGSVGSKPEIYPVYWSEAQMRARQSDRTATIQSFLNSFWKHTDDEGTQWFDPDRDALYPDRIRRRPPGTDSSGLGTHCDPGTLDLWMTQEYQKAFRHLFSGQVERYDPWDPAHRTDGPQYPGSTMCSAFRTFQGWTALSDMDADQGVLHTVPVPEVMAYLLLRPLLPDVPEDSMCGVRPNQVFPVTKRWHPDLYRALTPIPDVRAGDSVWWHCDMVHSVAPVENQKGWGNVMYIPAAPWCPRNEKYAADVREAFTTGSSPSDFPEEHYERSWNGRFTLAQLNETGRRGLGLPRRPDSTTLV